MNSHEVLDPWDAGVEPPAPEAEEDVWDRFNMLIGERNTEAIESSDGMLAVLDGTRVDGATASETDCAFTLGKKTPGYRGIFASRETTPEAPLTSRLSTSYEKAAAGQLAPQRNRPTLFGMFSPTECRLGPKRFRLTTPPVSVT